MLPYIHVNDIMIGGLPLHPFGLLVATGVLIGTALATWRAKQRGLDLDKLNSFITWMLLAGFIGGHMLDTIFYHPTEIAKIENGHFMFTRPWSLLLLYEGLSSFGGFVGAIIGIVLWKFYVIKPRKLGPVSIPWFARREGGSLPVVPFCDVILSVFPVAWMFGRTGCTVVHDHPGALAPHDALLAVGYPDRRQTYDSFIELVHGPVARYDLGLLELMFTIVLATLFALTWRKRLPTGTYLVAAALSYGPVRFAMDYLRIADTESADPRYGGLTPAQWCCLALIGVGVALYFLVVRKQQATGVDPMDALLQTDAPAESGGTAVPVE
jgi:phosphatidylglycerol:prolipoprotein diacylglycerol transferase